LRYTGCSHQGIPDHGGGKRFYFEQEILAAATRKAVSKINWAAIAGKKVNVYVLALGDEAGGSSDDGGLNLASALGIAGGGASKNVAAGGTGVATYSQKDVYGAFAFANARDIEYLKAVVMENIFKAKGMVARDDSDIAGDVYVIVDAFGTNRWKRDFLFYVEKNLASLVRLSAFFVDKNGTETDMEGNAASFKFMANYVFGIGPLNVGNEITVQNPPRWNL
jgi:hypothetical protein